ncbi:hypothetical protein B0H65DRAFT_176733 [Neurospora tetraspora]|uniref:Uncharacterized protein n=1 Tax=Neurospora tetraspora TaxID=94610 RepID=A0AAE0JJ57_9PEZI|nr:hypothetical protein B0H65DRAFT_176733 [Neurospora tetraspora]
MNLNLHLWAVCEPVHHPRRDETLFVLMSPVLTLLVRAMLTLLVRAMLTLLLCRRVAQSAFLCTNARHWTLSLFFLPILTCVFTHHFQTRTTSFP